MSLAEIEQAKRDALPRPRPASSGRWPKSSSAFSPANLASEAWDGVKDKSADIAEGAVEAVKKRPAGVAGARRLRLVPGPRAAHTGGRRLISGGAKRKRRSEVGGVDSASQRQK